MINHDPQKNKVEIPNFFIKIKLVQTSTIPEINLIFMHKVIFHQMMKNTLTKIISFFTQDRDLVLTVLTNQIFLNQTHETNKYDNLEIVQHLTTIIFNNKTQLTHNQTNQIKYIMKSTVIFFTTTQNNKKTTYNLFMNATCLRITTND